MSKHTQFILALALLAQSCGASNSGSDKKSEMPSTDSAAVPTQTTVADMMDSGAPAGMMNSASDAASISNGPTSFDEAAIHAFLQGGLWKEWTAESPIRPSVRAHGQLVQTFVNQPLLESLQAKNALHPVGSAAVKVLYGADGRSIRGYAFEQKTKAGDTGDAWVWYEGGGPSFPKAYYGQGLGVCTGCHETRGEDFVTVKLTELTQAFKPSSSPVGFFHNK